MQEITSFGPTDWTKPNQDLLKNTDIDSTYKEMCKKNPDYDLVIEALSGAADEILRTDTEKNRKSSTERLIEFSQAIKFTPNIKSSIAMHPKNWVDKGYMVNKQYSGVCLVCGKMLGSGDIVLADTSGESSCVCLECTDDRNELKKGFELILCK